VYFPFELDLICKILQLNLQTTNQHLVAKDNISALIRQGELNLFAETNRKFEKHTAAADDILNHRL
jgi:hypothetical protein